MKKKEEKKSIILSDNTKFGSTALGTLPTKFASYSIISMILSHIIAAEILKYLINKPIDKKKEEKTGS